MILIGCLGKTLKYAVNILIIKQKIEGMGNANIYSKEGKGDS